MKRTKLLTKTLFAATLAVGSLAMAASSEATPKCPTSGMPCTREYAPVICANGQVYGNACMALADCAVGCVPYVEPAS